MQHLHDVLRLLALLGVMPAGSPVLDKCPVLDAAAIPEPAFAMQPALVAKVVLARRFAVDKWFDPPAQTAPMPLAKEDLAILSAKTALKSNWTKVITVKAKALTGTDRTGATVKARAEAKEKGRAPLAPSRLPGRPQMTHETAAPFAAGAAGQLGSVG